MLQLYDLRTLNYLVKLSDLIIRGPARLCFSRAGY